MHENPNLNPNLRVSYKARKGLQPSQNLIKACKLKADNEKPDMY
jgi:hypothetical protein